MQHWHNSLDLDHPMCCQLGTGDWGLRLGLGTGGCGVKQDPGVKQVSSTENIIQQVQKNLRHASLDARLLPSACKCDMSKYI